MFTKIKTAFLSFIHPFIARLYEMTVEAQFVAAAGAAEKEGATLLQDAVAEVEKVVAKVEALVEPAKTVPAAAPVATGTPVLAQVGTATLSSAAVQDQPVILSGVQASVASAPVAVSDITATITKVKDLLDLAERLPSSFDALAALAMKEPTIEAVAVKLKSYLAYAKADAVDVFDEVLAAAKAL